MSVVARFLERGPARGWTRRPLAGDASTRRYERLTGPGGATAVLMDSGDDLASFGAFLRMTAHLRQAGLAAPEVLDVDPASGLALLEDLGPTDVASALRSDPAQEAGVAEAVAALLVRLHQLAPPDGLARLTPETGGAMLAPLAAYAPDVALAPLAAAMSAALAASCGPPEVLALRDLHGENLIWRPERAGTSRLGLVDYQDALLAPMGYDLASYVGDARRDVPPEVRALLVARLATAGRCDAPTLDAAVSVLAVQRNLRILGIFARLAREGGKRRYLAFLPRLWRQLGRDLAHPALATVRPLAADLPDPAAAMGALDPA